MKAASASKAREKTDKEYGPTSHKRVYDHFGRLGHPNYIFPINDNMITVEYQL